MNSLIRCAVTLAIFTFILLISVSLIKLSTAKKIELSQYQFKYALVNELLHNIRYDRLSNLEQIPQMPIKLTPATSLLSFQSVIINQVQTANVFELSTINGYNGEIKLLIALRADGVVSGVRVIEHHETPGLGDKIDLSRSEWIYSFVEKSLNNTPDKEWKVKRDGGQFDQFTGATITPRAVVSAVHDVLLFVQSNHKQLFPKEPTKNNFNN